MLVVTMELTLFNAAPCLTLGFRDCNECGDREGCQVGTYCNCYSDCYDYGDCCPDVSHMKNCVGTFPHLE